MEGTGVCHEAGGAPPGDGVGAAHAETPHWTRGGDSRVPIWGQAKIYKRQFSQNLREKKKMRNWRSNFCESMA